jgi:hypothetical protein
VDAVRGSDAAVRTRPDRSGDALQPPANDRGRLACLRYAFRFFG